MNIKPSLSFHGITAMQFVETMYSFNPSTSMWYALNRIIGEQDLESNIVILKPDYILDAYGLLDWNEIQGYVQRIAELYDLPHGWVIFTVE